MPRNVPAALAAHLAGPATTACCLLKIMPKLADIFGLTTLDRDVTYDDGAGAITYRAKCGYTAMDAATHADMSVDNSEASGLLADYPLDGVTMEGIARGDYDGARYVQYIVNYEDLTQGHAIIDGGTVGQVTVSANLGVQIELRSLIQTLKQKNLIELTSITDRAAYGDERNKVTLVWYDGTVTAVGAEADRTFTVDLTTSGGTPSFAADYFIPGVVHWLDGDNVGHEQEIESFEQNTGGTVTFTLAIPAGTDIQVNDSVKVRQDSDGSWATAVARGYHLDFRGEPFMKRADGNALQSPTHSA